MGSGNYESQILEAIQILVDDAVSKANYDKTIQGTISRCVDATIGKYIVRYQDSSFYAYSHNTETTYPAGTSVYVLVPGNDMSRDKSIIGTVDHLGPDYVSIIEGENGYEVTGVNTINADGTFGLCSYKKEDLKILYDRDNNVDLIGLDVFGFENYIKQSSSIICGATFKTALDSAQKYRGDYGIVFHLDFTDKSTGEVVTKSYIVNVDQMTGNPYNYTIASRQYGIFDVDGANFISVKQIYLFAYDFPNTAEGKENDIFVSKVELSAANALEKEAAATCALTFVTPQGTYFDENDIDGDIRTLQAQIRIKGNAIDNNSQNVDYYWFRENNDITAKSEKYNQYGGAGWECLNNYSVIQSKTEDNEAVVQWARSGYQYITKKADNVARETTYKCVAVYFDGTILSKTIVIYNYSSNYEISIKSDSGVAFNYDLGKPTLTCYVNGQEETSDTYDYVWSVINSSNQFSVLKETTTENEEYSNAVAQRDAILAKISAEQLLTAADSENLSLYNQIIDQYEYIMRVENNKIHNLKISSITNFSTYKCSVYKSGVFIGTASIIITNTEEANPNYTLIIDNGNQIFKYNEKGISPANGSNQNPQVIEPISFTLYDEKGQKINHNVIKNIEWKVPSRDTLLDVSLTHGNGTKNEDGTKSYFNDPELNILIAPNYNAHYDKNEIQLILTYNDKVISAKTNFTFVKEGESGTNGTDFVCKIIPNGIEGAIVPKYPTVIYNKYIQQYTLNYTPKKADTWFKVQLWHDGELIFEGTQTGNTIENKEAKVQWMMLQNTYSPEIKDDSNFTINKNTAAITFDTTEYNNPANIVKAVVRYNNVDYYATLPISIIRLVNDSYDVQLLDTSGFRHVMYTTDGQAPAFDNQPFELIVSQIVEGVKNDISQFSSSEFAVDYNWEVKGSVYYLDWQSELNLIENSLYKTKEKRNQKYFKPIDTYNGLCVTNALVCNITRGEEELASIHIPIHFYINRYGNAALNGWDGNSISLDEEGGIILAPQVGAGTKNEDNTFTGVFMGSVKEPGAEKEEHGLFGYNAGQRTITLNSEDGSARFGKEGLGQIVIDPTTNEAIIRSGEYDTKTGVGMEINLTEPSIKFASGKFEVDKNGNVTADSFATRSSVEKLEEQTADIEQTITYFDVTPQTNFVVVSTNTNHYPLENKTYTINTYPLYKGQLVTSGATAKLKGSQPQGIQVNVNANEISFTVTNNTAIINNTTDVAIIYEYTSSAGVDYSIEKIYSLSLAVQGKDGYQGSDGKSAYQVWLDAGNIGTEEDYFSSLKGADGEPGKQGEKGEDGAPGRDGEKGDDGIGVQSIIEQYYLSTSNTTQSGGSWKTTQDAWSPGKYIWTRSEITWTDGHVTHTDPVLAEAINTANSTASSAQNTANTANTNASNAVNTANTAKETANTVQAGITYKENHYNFKYYTDVIVYGDSNKFYPVIIKYGNQDVKRTILVKRGYAEQAPKEWNKQTHPGSLTLKILCNFGGWGGANYSWEIAEFEEMYSQIFGGAINCGNNCMFAIFLRGGGETGAKYHLYSDMSLTVNGPYDYGWDEEQQLYTQNRLPSPQISYRINYVQYKSDLCFGYPGNKTPVSTGKYEDLQYKVDAPAPRNMIDSGQTTDGGFIKYIRDSAQNEEIRIRQYVKLTQNNDKKLVSSTTTEYYLSTSNSTLTEGSWTTTLPAKVSNTYLWTRQKIVYKDGSSITSTATCLDNKSGGRNLLIGTATATGDVANGTGTLVNNLDLFDGLTGVKTNTAWQERYVNLKNVYERNGFRVGDVLTLSVYVKSDSATTKNFGLFRASSGSQDDSSKTVNLTSNWQQIYFTFIANDYSKTATTTRIECSSASDTNYIYWAGWKLEKGNIASDWTPAPEDTQTDINNAVASTVKSTITYYAVSDSKTESPNLANDAIWKESTQELTGTANKYIWSKTRTTYVDNTYKDSLASFLYQDVKILDKIVLWYATADNTSVAPTTGWSTEPPGSTDLFIWTKTVQYYTDGSDNFDEAVAVCDTTIAKLQDGIEAKGAEIFGSLQDKGFVRIYEDRIYLLDNKTETQVTQAICMNNKGIAFAKAPEGEFLEWDAQNQEFKNSFTSVWGIEGTFDLQGLNVINIKAENIKDGTLTLGKDKNQSGHLEIFGTNEESPTIIANGDGIIISLANGGEIRLSEAEGLIVTHGSAANKEYGSYQDGKGFEANHLRANEEMHFGNNIAAKPMSITTADGVTHIGVGFIKIIS